MSAWLKAVKDVAKCKEWWLTLKQKMQGHFEYFGVSGNNRSISGYYHSVKRLAFKWLNRRSQRKSMTWEHFGRYLEKYPLPLPRIKHNFFVTTG